MIDFALCLLSIEHLLHNLFLLLLVNSLLHDEQARLTLLLL
jgi:hypothetical protein